MSPFFPFASTHDVLWWLFASGPFGLAAQFFLDPQTTVASTAAEEEMRLRGVTCEPPSLFCDTSNVQSLVATPSVKPFVSQKGGPQWLSSQFEHDDVAHHFKIYVPSGYNGQPLPMIVMLHGAQQDPDDFAVGTEMNAAAEAQGYIVVYPEQSESANPLKCWNWFRPADRRVKSGATAMVAALTREVMAMYNVDDARVYVAGMSAGGAMAINLPVTHRDATAAAAIHSGVA